jgi:hypothetical protein
LATNLIEGRHDTRTVQQLLGLKDLASMTSYTMSSSEAAPPAHRRPPSTSFCVAHGLNPRRPGGRLEQSAPFEPLYMLR